jgi:hypothetical protein
LSICFCAAVFVVKMPPTTSQSVVVAEALDDVETVGDTVVVVVVSIDCNTAVDVVVWPGVVTSVGRDGTDPTTPATVPKVVVGSVLLAAEHADITTVNDNALATKTFDFGTGTPRENGKAPPRRIRIVAAPARGRWSLARTSGRQALAFSVGLGA